MNLSFYLTFLLYFSFKAYLHTVEILLLWTVLQILTNTYSDIIGANHDIEQSHNPPQNPLIPCALLAKPGFHCQPVASTDLFSDPMLLPLPECHISGILWYIYNLLNLIYFI